MLKKNIRNIIAGYPKYSSEDLIRRIKDFEYISFDVFDTMIKRNLKCPSDLFQLLGEDFGDANFKAERIAAEAKARFHALKRGQEEISINQIYECMPEPYCLNIEKWINAEIQKELEVCYANQVIKEVYEWCLSQQKKIIITSDMYLPLDALKKILHKCGYTGYDNIYLSSEIRLKKITGHIYPKISRDYNISNEKIIHLGDAIKSDYYMAKKMGVRAVLLARNNSGATKYCSYRDIDTNEKEKYKNLVSFIQNHISNQWDEYFQFGYEAFGPLLYGFSKWLIKEIQDKDLRKVFFFSRDGFIIQKAFNEITGGNIANSYFYVSRRSLRVPQLWINPEIEEVVDSFPQVTMLSMRAFLKNIGLNFDDYRDILSEFGLHENDTFKRHEIVNNKKLCKFYEHIKDKVVQNSLHEFNLLVEYMKQEGFEGNIAVVDIGWYGSLQYFLEKILKKTNLNVKMNGYYIGLTKEARTGIITNSYVRDEENSCSCDSWRGFSGLIEYLFLAQEGSTKTYRRNKTGKIEAVLYDYEYDINGNKEVEDGYVRSIQAGALQFIRDVMITGEYTLNYNSRTAYANIRNAGNYPTLNVCEMFGKIRFLEEKPVYLANPDNILNYIRNPKKFKTDFYYSKWKIGFLKQMFKVPLPYKTIYELAKKFV